MLKRALAGLGKSLLIVTGVGYGVLIAMDDMRDNSQTNAAGDDSAQHVLARLSRIEERLLHLETGIDWVSRAEMEAAIEQLSGSMASDLDCRFDVQNQSVQSLRTMIARTDELLEQVIENIESTSLSV